MNKLDNLFANQLHWIQRIRQGSSTACSELFDHLYDPIYRYCYYQVGNMALAQDLTSEVFVQIARNLDTFDEHGQSLPAWLYTIADNLIADVHSRNKQDSRLPPKEIVIARGLQGYLLAENLVAALAYLTEEQRQVILLQLVQDYSTVETAHLMSQSEQAIQSQSCRALAALRYDGEAPSTNPDFDAVLSECLDRLHMGTDIQTCLARYPQYATELHPLLQLADKIHEVITPIPAGRARIAGRLGMLQALAEKRNQQFATAPGSSRRATSSVARLTRRKPLNMQLAWRLAFAVATVAILATGGAVAASTASLPGDVFYPVKLASQQAQMALTFDAGTRSQLEEQFHLQQRQDIQIAARLGRQATVELGGVLEQMDDNTWVVDGLKITLNPGTTMAGQPHVGDWVMVQGNLPGNGSLVATSLVAGDRHGPQPTATPSPAPEPSETPEPTDTREPTQTPKPTCEPEPTRTPAPTQMSTPTQPKPTEEPKPTSAPKPTQEPKPTKEPKPTSEPKPTQEPKPTKEPKPTRKP
jgi:RNA polymerase sigma factor (sigma-70 family)